MANRSSRWRSKLLNPTKMVKGSKCPECGSYEITFFLGGEAGQIYECKSCGYKGALIVESGNVGKEIKKDLKKMKREMKA